jgi:hypothetical protein
LFLDLPVAQASWNPNQDQPNPNPNCYIESTVTGTNAMSREAFEQLPAAEQEELALRQAILNSLRAEQDEMARRELDTLALQIAHAATNRLMKEIQEEKERQEEADLMEALHLSLQLDNPTRSAVVRNNDALWDTYLAHLGKPRQ